jgi:hypothetical protein
LVEAQAVLAFNLNPKDRTLEDAAPLGRKCDRCFPIQMVGLMFLIFSGVQKINGERDL